MRTTILTLLLSCLSMSFVCEADIEGSRFQQSIEAVKSATFGHIDAKGLFALMDSQTPFVLLDARGEQWHDGDKIPGANLAWYLDSEEVFDRLIPSKETLVVVYCFSFSCPLSGRLASKLVKLGYSNVIEYPAGLQEWREIANYPVERI